MRWQRKEWLVTIKQFLRIGDLAKQSGVSARALRLYESTGLLRPSSHSTAGYRLYDQKSVSRLLHIRVLKQAGFSLQEIAELLARDDQVVSNILAIQVEKLEREMSERRVALDALRKLVDVARCAPQLPLSQLLEFIKMSNTFELSLTPQEREAQRLRGETLGPQKIAQAQEQWPSLIAKVRAAMEAGTPTNAKPVQELAKQWHTMVMSFTGGDSSITRKLSSSYVENPGAMAAQGMDMAMFQYIGKAMQSVGLTPPGP
jgi:MerR family transcriptional regulator, thiopeptide resistance regulator